MAFWYKTVERMRSKFGFAAALPVGASPLSWDVMRASSNFDVVSLSDTELLQRAITKITLGEVYLPTGRIVAADPLVRPDYLPFARTVQPGRYPVTLYAAQKRIAVSILRFAEGRPVKWELATIAGQDVADLKDGEFFGYGVDAGLGCYMDETAFGLIQAREKLVIEAKGSAYISYYDDVLEAELAANSDDYVMHGPVADNPVNVAIFSSGWGDGCYPVFWGLDVAGQPLLLLTDFFVLENADGRPVDTVTEQ